MNWTDDQERAFSIIFSEKNILVYGVAGTGKTALINEVCRRYRSMGKSVLRMHIR